MTRVTSPARAPGAAAATTAERLFDRIAASYDRTNTTLTLGLDASWRATTVRALAPRAGERVLDLCAGTLELSAALAATGASVVPVDRSSGMLRCGLARHRAFTAIQGCALALPFRAGSFDAATIAFGIRNVPGPARSLAEIRRVLVPGGRLAILEFVSPRGALPTAAHVFGVKFLVPLVGGLTGGHAPAYRYLARSIEAFLDLEGLAALVAEAGFRVRERRLLAPRGPAALVIAEAA